MRNIRLLVRKDFLSSVSTYSFYLVFLLVWVVIIPFSPHMIPMIFTILLFILVLSLFQSEENDLVCNIRAILPVRWSQIVVARYLYTYLIIGSMSAFCALACPLVNLLTGKMRDWGLPLALGISCSTLLCSIAYPLMYRFGVAKMRLLVTIIYIIFVAAFSALGPLLMEIEAFATPAPSPVLAALAVGGCILLSLLSLAISVRLKN